MGDSKIEWTDKTWNPVTGCSKVSSGCKYCYAERDWHRFVHLPAYAGRAFTDVACHEDRLKLPLTWRKPSKVFVNSMSDLFHADVPDEFIDQVLAIVGLSFVMGRGHVFQVLTKRPERMLSYFRNKETVYRVTKAMKRLGPADGLPGENSPPAWPLPNLWLGVSVEDQATANERIPLLVETPAAVRWISAEPLLGSIDLRKAGAIYSDYNHEAAWDAADFDWLVTGGESGPNARPMQIAWARQMRDQCKKVGVLPAFFFKQWGEWAPALSGMYFCSLDGNVDFDVRAGGKDTLDLGNGVGAVRIGKRKAGRMLVGVLHDEYP